tara:strand:+ start:369 stop:518 length:150 start_codon:yes stop_codon:yes gene_type:complete
MRILVTGHRGYIGSHLFAKLREMGHEVAGIDLEGCDIGDTDVRVVDIIR